MKSIHPFLLLSLLCLFGLHSPLVAQYSYTVCLSNEAGEKLIFVDLKAKDNQVLGQTGLDGCLSFTHPTASLDIQGKHLHYEPIQLTLQAGEHQALQLKGHPFTPVAGKETVPERASTATISGADPAGERTPTGKYRFSGVVLDQDSGEPLIGANVQVQGTSYGTVADLDGAFEITANDAEVVLLISYIGYTSFTTPASAGERLSVQMASSMVLDEVVVTESSRPGRSIRGRLGMTRKRAAAMEMAPAAVPSPPPPPSVREEIGSLADAPVAKDITLTYDPETYEARVESDADYAASGTKGEVAELPNAGQLTAGEINDFSKWAFWSDINQEDLGRHRAVWQQHADHRYTLQLTTTTGAAVVDAPVELFDGQGNVLWRARTDAQGRAELWAHYFRDVDQPANGLRMRGTVEGKDFELAEVTPFHQGINFHTVAAACTDQPIVDVAFVVDATGSMGDEINYLQAELLDVMQRAQDSLAGADLRLGSVFYRDLSDEYLTRHHAMTANFTSTVKFVQQQSANGGGDGPEAVEDALEVALNQLNWREEATARILFLVLDAPPHQAEDNVKRMQIATARAAAAGIQIIPVACSGIDKSTEYLMRSMALATNGTYTFLTDHSGIGNKHIEPSTDSYEVEYLNGVLLRLLVARSQLQSCSSTEPIAELLPEPVVEPATNSWSCYPNPTSGPLTVRSAMTATEGFLLDSNGKLLQRFAVSERFDLDLSTYPAGQYYLKLGEKSAAQAVVLMRY